MIVTIDADTLAIALAHKKVEKKYEDLKIEYTVNGTDGGAGGFVRKITGVKRI